MQAKSSYLFKVNNFVVEKLILNVTLKLFFSLFKKGFRFSLVKNLRGSRKMLTRRALILKPHFSKIKRLLAGNKSPAHEILMKKPLKRQNHVVPQGYN